MSTSSMKEERSSNPLMDIENIMNGFGPEDLSYLEDVQRRAREAMKTMDKAALDALIQEMKDYKKKKGIDSCDDPEFNLDDFKGCF